MYFSGSENDPLCGTEGVYKNKKQTDNWLGQWLGGLTGWRSNWEYKRWTNEIKSPNVAACANLSSSNLQE